jgi:hypothetical protein
LRDCSYKVYYVKIALGCFFLACLFVSSVGAALWLLLFTAENNIQIKAKAKEPHVR